MNSPVNAIRKIVRRGGPYIQSIPPTATRSIHEGARKRLELKSANSVTERKQPCTTEQLWYRPEVSIFPLAVNRLRFAADDFRPCAGIFAASAKRKRALRVSECLRVCNRRRCGISPQWPEWE